MFEIRKYQEKDREEVRKICMETAKKGYQNNETVCYMFLDYFLDSEPNHAYVLIHHEKVIGYIVVSINADLYEKKMKEKWIPMIQKKSFILGIFSRICLKFSTPFNRRIGGSFHMNITSKYQGLRLGNQLLDVMKEHLRILGESHLYCFTENKKTRGYGFYRHYGFKEVKKYILGFRVLSYEVKK